MRKTLCEIADSFKTECCDSEIKSEAIGKAICQSCKQEVTQQWCNYIYEKTTC